MKTRPIYALDLLRCAAAIAVVGYHLSFKAWRYVDHEIHDWLGAPTGMPAWAPITWWGWIGVQIFFVISGFVIAQTANGASPYGFVASRVRRLVPGAWICATIALGIYALRGSVTPETCLLWFRVVAFAPVGPWLLGQFWTLPIEIAFYSVVLVFLVADRMAWLPSFALLLGVGSTLYHFGVLPAPLSPLLLLQHGCFFALDMAIWTIERFGRSVAAMATLIVSAAAAVMQIRAMTLGEARGFETGSAAVPVLVFFAAVSFLWLGVRHNDRLDCLDPHTGAIRLIGLLTYPLYLVHIQIGGLAVSLTMRLGENPGAAIFVAVLASILLATAIAAWIEPIGQ